MLYEIRFTVSRMPLEDCFSFLLGPHMDDVRYAQVDDFRRSRTRLSRLRLHAQRSILADFLGKPYEYLSIGQRRLYPVADGRASLVIGQRELACPMISQFIEALFKFEEQLREQPITVDGDLPFLPDRRG